VPHPSLFCSDEGSDASSSSDSDDSKAGAVDGVKRVGGLKRGRKPGGKNKATAGVAAGGHGEQIEGLWGKHREWLYDCWLKLI